MQSGFQNQTDTIELSNLFSDGEDQKIGLGSSAVKIP